MPPQPSYVIDTSSVLEWFVRTYPPSIFPGIKTSVESLIQAGRLVSPKAVLDEIKPGDDCHAWAKEPHGLFVDEAEQVQTAVRKLLAKHHNAQKPHKGISGADPFVIAMAQCGGSGWVVVSDEHPGTIDNKKIPFVCKAEGVTCIRFQELMRAEGWKF